MTAQDQTSAGSAWYGYHDNIPHNITSSQKSHQYDSTWPDVCRLGLIWFAWQHLGRHIRHSTTTLLQHPLVALVTENCRQTKVWNLQVPWKKKQISIWSVLGIYDNTFGYILLFNRNNTQFVGHPFHEQLGLHMIFSWQVTSLTHYINFIRACSALQKKMRKWNLYFIKCVMYMRLYLLSS